MSTEQASGENNRENEVLSDVSRSEINRPSLSPRSWETRSHANSDLARNTVQSTAARKRRLELIAFEQRAKIRKSTLAAQEQVDLEVINRRLETELAELEEQDDRTSQVSRTERWVDTSVNESPRNENRRNIVLGEPSTSDDVDRLTLALSRVFETIQGQAGGSNANQQLATRLTASRELPTFDGDPLEWPRFKRAFEASTQRAGYTEDENVSRLFNCLRKEAKDAVASLMITATGTSEIMGTLQLRFGNPELVAQKIGRELRRLPRLDGSRGNLVSFATTVKNCVAAMEAIGHLGYLHSPELLAEIIGKLPESMVHAYNRFHHEKNVAGTPKLAILAEFLRFEADIACQAGTFVATKRLSRGEHSRHRSRSRGDRHPHESYPHRGMVFTTDDNDVQERGKSEQRTRSGERNRSRGYRRGDVTRNRDCPFCRSSRHKITECEEFKKEPVRRRWRWAKDARVCFRCLGTNHNRNACTAELCRHTGCHRSHHVLLHSENRQGSPNSSKKKERAEDKSNQDNHTVANTWESKDKRVLLKVLPVKLRGPKGSAVAYALLDDGSTVTLLDADLAREIGASGEIRELKLNGVNRMRDSVINSRQVKFRIGKVSGDNDMFDISDARTIPNLSLPCQSVREEDFKDYRHLDNVPVHCYQRAVPKILIGQDHWNLITPLEIRSAAKNAPVASRTPLGWVMHGYASSTTLRNKKQNILFTQQTVVLNEGERQMDSINHDKADRELQDIVKLGFTLEAMGISTASRKSISVQQAEHTMEQTAKRIGDQWEIGLLWKHNERRFPDTYSNALNRLKAIERKMEREPLFKIAYGKEIHHLMKCQYAQRIESFHRNDHMWFLPHFGVTNPNKPGKLRLVFDAASKVQGRSLNDYLLSGPDLLNSLLGVLMRFRQRRIAFTADIKEMFLQIKIREEDRDAQMFLWRDGDSTRAPDVYQMTSMIFGASSSPASALFIKNRNAQDYEAECPKAVEAITRKHYMDDYLDSVDTVGEGVKLINDVIKIHQRGGFNIRGWTSNDSRVLNHLPEEKLSKGTVNLALDKSQGERTLGLIWRPIDDTLTFAIDLTKIRSDLLSGTERPTKREMLRLIMSVFDPQGLLTPFTISGKIMLQNVWISGIEWDGRLADSEFNEWQKWVKKLQEVPNCVIPRCYIPQDQGISSIELHMFCDASQQAFAAVGYWRIISDTGVVSVTFVAGKSRVAPLKPRLSIPRMELQAALLGSRLARTISKEHEFSITRRIYWTDARCVLSWIKSDPRKHNAWLANRLGEIDELSNAEEWKWVSSKENPADDATRGTGHVPTAESRWFRGPKFLREEESEWPRTKITEKDYDSSEELQTKTITLTTDEVSSALPDVTRFSSWLRLVRSTARVLIFIDVCLGKAKPELTREYLEKAETLWIRKNQQTSFDVERRAIQEGKTITKGSRLIQLTPILDEDGLLRVKGRIQATGGISQNTKTPIILDGRSVYVRLLVMHYHRQAGHGSPETVLNELRQKYWIVHARPTIRSVTAHCQWCHVQKVKPQIPLMGDLPAARLEHHKRPFTFCGVDYFGPMMVTVGRRHEKRWGVLFTCLTTRAIHLEMAASLSTDSAIMALRRFAARRGYPSEMWSDNGTNLRGTDAELRRELQSLDQKKYQADVTAKNLIWHFIPPFSPHMGGSWERLIKSVKIALRATLKERAPREETLLTLFAEAEHSVNSRPLTHVSTDPRDPETLTPNHFLIGASSGVAIPTQFGESDLCLRKQWIIAQRLADMFWTRWLKEYLPTLQPRRQWNTESLPVQIGDVVLLVDSNVPRNVWTRGIITNIIPGTDGRIRVAEVRTGKSIFIRSVAKLIPLARADNGTDVLTSVPGGSMSPT